jgi:hypothetical protein
LRNHMRHWRRLLPLYYTHDDAWPTVFRYYAKFTKQAGMYPAVNIASVTSRSSLYERNDAPRYFPHTVTKLSSRMYTVYHVDFLLLILRLTLALLSKAFRSSQTVGMESYGTCHQGPRARDVSKGVRSKVTRWRGQKSHDG